jgi:hypothetical protein
VLQGMADALRLLGEALPHALKAITQADLSVQQEFWREFNAFTEHYLDLDSDTDLTVDDPQSVADVFCNLAEGVDCVATVEAGGEGGEPCSSD